MKTILLTFFFTISLVANEQLILVVSKDFNTSQGMLYTYEKHVDNYDAVFTPIKVNLGRHGLAWGVSETHFTQHPNDPQKYEGDGKSPAGIFPIRSSFGYAKNSNAKLPYLYATHDLVCVDDIHADDYNRILYNTKAKQSYHSYEIMRRDDNLYQMGLVVDYNPLAVPSRGSCIFLHLQKSDNAPTAGCTAMSQSNIEKIITWLDPEKKPILVQIPASSCKTLPYPYHNLPCE